jgi:hypothetical protein
MIPPESCTVEDRACSGHSYYGVRTDLLPFGSLILYVRLYSDKAGPRAGDYVQMFDWREWCYDRRTSSYQC